MDSHRTTVHLTAKSKSLLDNNITNVSDWVNGKVSEQFDGLSALKQKESNLLLELVDIREQINKQEIKGMIKFKSEEIAQQTREKEEKKIEDQTEKIQSMVEQGIKTIKNNNVKTMDSMVLTLDKIKATEHDIGTQILFSKQYMKIIKQVDQDRGIDWSEEKENGTNNKD